MANFLTDGFHEIQRMFGRFSLKREIARQNAERASALVALGQRAWETRVDLSTYPDLRDRLTSLDARAGEISQTTSKLEGEKASLEQERRGEVDKFGGRRREVEEKKTPVDAALRTARARRSECEQTISRAEARLAKIPLELAAPADKLTADQRSRITSEQKELEAKLPASRAELPAISAEESRLTAESRQYADQIAAIGAEEKTALARIDGELSRVQSELRGASQQATATAKDRDAVFGTLGGDLYDAGSSAPALADQVARVKTIDETRAQSESVMNDSLAQTKALAPGTMAKFWGVAGAVAVLIVVVVVLMNRTASDEAASVLADASSGAGSPRASTERRAGPDPEIAKTDLVKQFVQAADATDKNLRTNALRILKQDIETMGASGDPAHLATLVKVLRSPEADLRQAAADSIGMIGATPEEVPELTRLLKDPVPGVAAAAKRALDGQRAH